MKPLITLENVDVAFGGKVVLRGLNWQLHPGENWAIVGGNGSGKSTFLKLIRSELWPAPRDRSKRVYALDGDEQSTAVGIRQRIALVSPELQARYLQQEWRLTGLEAIYTGFFGTELLYQKPGARQKQFAHSLVQMLGVDRLLTRNVQQLSTGELRKILIARALAGAPSILVCDEICDGLDAASRGLLLQTLDRIARNGTQLLYTTHRPDEFIPSITHVLRLEKGLIAGQGRIGRSAAVSSSTNRSIVPGAAAGSATTAALRGGNPISKIQNPKSVGLVLIQIRNASVFLGRKKILHDINWELRTGQHWGVLGGNGAGKTTFLKLIASEIYPAVGADVRRFDLNARDSIWDLRRRLGVVSPTLQAGYREALTGAEVVSSGFFSSIGLMSKVSARRRRKVADLFRSFGFTSLAGQCTLSMSYGEFRTILFLRALVNDPKVLILDEPFDGLDSDARVEFARSLEKVARRGASLVVVTHHPADLPSCVTHVVRLAGGRIVEQGPCRAGGS